ncbi:hypothetical protein GCM10011609_71600 [Lentzea pudingi]|uniref:Uncharacterized protein n=1 Tax=Lentzea pudingi TaxID=1789439 RepID=A0ABQ2INP6_9PSEU|nr:hypothetical protein GCM10011609_71600 [Lentzea pudingi]
MNEKSPLRDPVHYVLRAILVLCGALIVLEITVAYLRTYWAWTVGIGGTAVAIWLAVAIVRWAWSRRK